MPVYGGEGGSYNGIHWTGEQLANARLIMTIGQRLGFGQRDIRIALMTAMQESSLQNLHYGDGDSLGLFQQTHYWGTPQQRTNATYATTAFFHALRGVANRGSMSLTQAAQAVQRSAYPNAYAKWADDAAHLIGHLGGVPGGGGGGGDIGGGRPMGGGNIGGGGSGSSQFGFNPVDPQTQPNTGQDIAASTPIGLTSATTAPSTVTLASTDPAAPQTHAVNALGLTDAPAPLGLSANPAQSAFMDPIPGFGDGTGGTAASMPHGGAGGGGPVNGWRAAVVQAAHQALGTPYVWGGESPSGFDCSGLVQWAFKQAGISMARVAYQQADGGRRINPKDLKPGDLVAWNNEPGNGVSADHIAIYIGHGKIIEAPRPGLNVRISGLYDYDVSQMWGVRIHR